MGWGARAARCARQLAHHPGRNASPLEGTLNPQHLPADWPEPGNTGDFLARGTARRHSSISREALNFCFASQVPERIEVRARSANLNRARLHSDGEAFHASYMAWPRPHRERPPFSKQGRPREEFAVRQGAESHPRGMAIGAPDTGQGTRRPHGHAKTSRGPSTHLTGQQTRLKAGYMGHTRNDARRNFRRESQRTRSRSKIALWAPGGDKTS